MTPTMANGNEKAGRDAAESFRLKNKLGFQPIPDMVTLIEQTTDCDVAIVSADEDEHGLTVFDGENGPSFIAVAKTLNPVRQRSTLAHELAHVVFGDAETADGRDLSRRSPVEIRADAFARHLLIPIDGLIAYLGDPTGALPEFQLSSVVQRFRVSPAIAAIALSQSGHISVALKEEWLKITTPSLAAKYGWTDDYQSWQDETDRLRAPQKLLARAIEGYSLGVVGPQVIATLRGVSSDAAVKDLREGGVVPPNDEDDFASVDDLLSLSEATSGSDE